MAEIKYVGAAALNTALSQTKGYVDQLNNKAVNEFNTALDEESTNRTLEDAKLQEKITQEIADRTDADALLQSDLNTEKEDRKAEDQKVLDEVDAERFLRELGDSDITISLNTEIKNRTDADTGLQAAIDLEAKTREEQDTETDNKLNDEITNRITAGNTLQTNINNEASERATQDEILDAAIEQEITDRTTAITNLETKLQEQIDTNATDIFDLQTNLEQEITDRKTKNEEHETSISENATNIATNTTDIATNKENIETNKENIATNKASIDKILDGSTVAAKAKADEDGNEIKTTYATLESPALTGTPTAPTAVAGTDTTQIATTAFVTDAVTTETTNRDTAITTAKEELQNNIDTVEAKVDAIEVNDATLTIQKNATDIDTFTSNSATDKTINIEVPTKVSELTNDSAYITKAVKDLTNYYLKTETYTQTEVNDLLASVSGIEILIVDTLPDEGVTGKIYYLSKESGGYQEYVWSNGAWVELSTSEISLEDYYTKEQTDANIATVSTNLTTEITDRTTADETLQTNIDTVSTNLTTETSERKAADTTLQTNINTVSTNLATETTNRTTADTTLQTNINNEVTNRTTADEALQTSIDNLETSLTSATTDIATKQDKLTAGDNITIENNVISSTAESPIASISVNGTTQTIDDNKNVNITIPTKTSDLTNDSDFATTSDIPTKVSELTNDSEFITISSVPTKVSELTNDSDFQTETEVNNLIAAAVGDITSLEYEVVTALPTAGEKGTIYLIASTTTTDNNIYDEYIWLGSSYEKIGTTDIDLSNYYTQTEVDTLLEDKADTSTVDTLETTVDTLNTDLTNLETEVNTQSTTITNLNTTVNNLSSQVVKKLVTLSGSYTLTDATATSLSTADATSIYNQVSSDQGSFFLTVTLDNLSSTLFIPGVSVNSGTYTFTCYNGDYKLNFGITSSDEYTGTITPYIIVTSANFTLDSSTNTLTIDI